jgi:hypothetical protein
MGRSVGQTSIPPLERTPPQGLGIPEMWQGADVEAYYGYFPLGNGPDTRIDFALGRRGGPWILQVDRNNNEDLTDDGPPMGNEGTGVVMAREVSVEVAAVDASGATRQRPYDLWVFFNDSDGFMRGSFYARNHYRGEVSDGRVSYAATAYEKQDHDGLYRDSGICIDLNRDGDCSEERELFRDGATVPFPGGTFRLVLSYP